MNTEGCTVRILLCRPAVPGPGTRHKTIHLRLAVPWGDPGVAEAVMAEAAKYEGWMITGWAPHRPQAEQDQGAQDTATGAYLN